jgi:hypothetical protein
MIVQAPSSPEGPFFAWQSDSVGIGLQAREYPARQMPIFWTCAHRRLADGLPRSATARVFRLLSDIGRGSFVNDLSREAIRERDQSVFVRFDFAYRAILPLEIAIDLCRYLLGHGDVVKAIPRRSTSEAAPDFLIIEGEFAGFHLALHQRAGLPFQWLEYRAIGPRLSSGIANYFEVGNDGLLQ